MMTLDRIVINNQLLPKFDSEYNLADIVSPCVYFLFQNNAIVYVGMSDNYFGRIASHINSTKKFDTIRVIKCKTSQEALDLESSYIIKYKPFYNRAQLKKINKIKDDSIFIDIHEIKFKVQTKVYKISYKLLEGKYIFSMPNINGSFTKDNGLYKGALRIFGHIYYFSGYNRKMTLRAY